MSGCHDAVKARETLKKQVIQSFQNIEASLDFTVDKSALLQVLERLGLHITLEQFDAALAQGAAPGATCYEAFLTWVFQDAA
mmetsp:Transcript_50283/g.144950  ORF Transcript_50283/g.144950 Transcript_50283/m.144950 type:complete len:82 (+) Transcript_50283:253-498(+)